MSLEHMNIILWNKELSQHAMVNACLFK